MERGRIAHPLHPGLVCAQLVAVEPRLHHGEGPATWPVLRQGSALGRDLRIGLEDTLRMPDGTLARDNAALVAAAARLASL